MTASRTVRVFGFLAFSALCLRASVAQESAVTFQDHVFPIFTTHCTGCHNADKKKGDLDLSTYSAAMAGGGSGDVAAAGDSAASVLFKVVAHLADPKMPPKKPKISDAEILTIKKWIDGGLIDAPGGKAKKGKGPTVDLALKAGATGKPKGPAAMPEDLLLEPEIRTVKAEAVTALAASPWAPLAAVAGQHQVLLYNTDTLDLAGILPFPERRPTILRFSRNGSLLLAGGGRGANLGRVVLYDVKSGDRVTEIGQEFDQVLAADLSPDQGLVALGGPGKLVKIYATKDGDLEHSIKKHTDWVTALEFSPDGVLLASGDRSGGLHVWEARTGRIFYTLTGHKGAITDLSWRADANLLASSSEDGQVMLWEMGNGTRVKGWSAHPAASSVKYAIDGRIVTCGRDMLVRTWDGTGTKLKDFEAFTDLALRAVFSHDGARVIAGDWTGEIRVWTSADARRVGQLSTNPPSLGDRLAADLKALEEAKPKAEAAAKERAAAAAKVEQLAPTILEAQVALQKTLAEQAQVEAKVAEADRTEAMAATAVKDAQAALAARQNESSDKAKALKQAEADPKLADTIPKAKAEAEQAANAMGPAQKALTEAQDAHKAAGEAKAAAKAAQAKAKEAAGAATARVKSLETQAEMLKAPLAQAVQADDTARAQVAALEKRIASLKAAEFNVQVHAAKRELARVQAEFEALGSKGEEARKAAADADAKAKAAVQAVGPAQLKIKQTQTAMAETKAGPAKAEAAQKAAQKVQAEKDARAAQALPFAAQLAESAKQAPDNATLAQAAAKAKETSDLLAKDAADARAVVAARAAEVEKAKAAIPVAEKAVADAQGAAEKAATNAVTLQNAAKAAADKIAPEQAQAEAFRPKVDAARAKVEALKAEYLKLKPKAL